MKVSCLLLVSLLAVPHSEAGGGYVRKLRSTPPNFPPPDLKEPVVEMNLKNPGVKRRFIADKSDLSRSLSRRTAPALNFVSPIEGATQKICYDCDPQCQAAITGTGESLNGYFNTVTQELNQIFAVVGITFYFEVKKTKELVVLYEGQTILQSQAYQRWSDLLEGYWVVSGRAVKHRNNYGCDINILVGEDEFFEAYDSFTGMTYLLALCSDDAVIVQKLMTNYQWMASGLAHEIGHLTGMLHNSVPVPSYYSAYTDVVEQCQPTTWRKCGPQNNEGNKCVMVAGFTGVNTPPDEISDCSKTQLSAYMDILANMDTVANPTYRDIDECLNLNEYSSEGIALAEGSGSGSGSGA